VIIAVGGLHQGSACFRTDSITSIVSIIVDITHPSNIVPDITIAWIAIHSSQTHERAMDGTSLKLSAMVTYWLWARVIPGYN
jgi:hypothetical protein